MKLSLVDLVWRMNLQKLKKLGLDLTNMEIESQWKYDCYKT